MVGLAKTTNNQIELTPLELEQLIISLHEGKEVLYEKHIKIPYTLMLEQLIHVKFEKLQAIKAAIINDTFEKFKYDLLKGIVSTKQVITKLKKRVVAECEIAVPSENQIKQNMGLTQKEFIHLVTELKNGNQTLFEKIYLAHFKKCTHYLRMNCGADAEVAHTCTMDALIEIRRDLIQDKVSYGNLAFYVTRRARMKLFKLKKLGKNSMQIVSMNTLKPSGNNHSYKLFEIRDLIHQTFSKMCQECQQLLEQKYRDGLNYNEIVQLEFPNIIGSSLKTKANNLAKKAERCRKEFKYIIEKL